MPFIHLSKPTECIRMNLSVNHGLGVIMMCQCRFIGFNKGNAVVQDVNSGGGLALVAAGAVWKLYFLLNCCEPKTAVKCKVYLKNELLRRT